MRLQDTIFRPLTHPSAVLQWNYENRTTFVIVGILLVASLLRFYGINHQYVELFAWREADMASMADGFAAGNWNIFLPQVRWGGPGPNYIGAEFQIVTYIAALGYQLFGAAPWVGRFVSIAFSVFGIFALYQLVYQVWDEPRAIASAAVMAALPGSSFVERCFLPDGTATALMTTSLWMLVTYCETERLRYLLIAALAGMAGTLTKLPGGILIIPAIYATVSILGAKIRERRVQFRLAFAGLAVGLPVIVYYLWARYLSLNFPPYTFMGEGKFLWHAGFRSWLNNYYFLPEFGNVIAKYIWTLPFVGLAVAGIVAPLRVEKRHVAPWLFHAWLLAMIVRYVIEAKHLVTDWQNLHLLSPMIAAFSGHALVTFATSVRFQKKQTAGFFSAIIFGLATIVGQVQTFNLYSPFYSDHYGLGRTLAELSRPGDVVISMGLETVLLYYCKRNGWAFPPYNTKTWDYGQEDLSLLRELKAQGGAKWIAIPSFNSYTGSSGQEYLRRYYPVLYHGILESFDVVREIPEGLILRAK